MKAWKSKYSKVVSEPDTPPPPELKDAPVNLCQPSFMYPEAPLWILMKDHYLFTITKKEEKNPEDKTLKMTAKGTFLSRNAQRSLESKRAKTELTASENNENKKRKVEAAITHAEAASKHASSTLASTQLQAIAQAKDLGFGNIRLKSLMAQTLESLFGKQKQSEDENEDDMQIMSGEETRASGEETATTNANDLTTETVGVAKDLLHFAGHCAASDSQDKVTRKKLTDIFTPSTAASSAKSRPVSVIHLDVDLMNDFNEDASHVGKGTSPRDQQHLAQTMESYEESSEDDENLLAPIKGKGFKKPVVYSDSEDDDALLDPPFVIGARTSEASSAVNRNGNSYMPGAAQASSAVNRNGGNSNMPGAAQASSAVNRNGGNSNMPGAAHASCIVANCRAPRGMKPDYKCQSCDGAMHICCSKPGKDSFLYCLDCDNSSWNNIYSQPY